MDFRGAGAPATGISRMFNRPKYPRVGKWLRLLVVITMVCPTFAFASINSVEVSVEGVGISLRDAVVDGLKSAVSMVNGVEVSSKTSFETKSVSLEMDNIETYAASSAFANSIVTATKGIVESYDLIAVNRDPALGNSYVAQLSVKVAKYNKSKQLKRLRLSVTDITVDNAVTDQQSARQTAKDIKNSVVNYLTQTRRFAMIDRSNIADTQAELNYIATSGMATAELARLGNKVGADYLVLIKLIDLNTLTFQKKMKTINMIKESKKVFGEVVIRILDVATSQIKFSDSIYIETDKDYRVLGKKGGGIIGQVIQNAIYPARIVAVEGNIVTVGQGGRTMRRGEIYDLVRLGERLIDPYTRESIGFKETPVGFVEIERVLPKQSTGRIIELFDANIAPITNYRFILRPVHAGRDDEINAAQERVKKAKSRVNELKQSFSRE